MIHLDCDLRNRSAIQAVLSTALDFLTVVVLQVVEVVLVQDFGETIVVVQGDPDSVVIRQEVAITAMTTIVEAA